MCVNCCYCSVCFYVKKDFLFLFFFFFFFFFLLFFFFFVVVVFQSVYTIVHCERLRERESMCKQIISFWDVYMYKPLDL